MSKRSDFQKWLFGELVFDNKSNKIKNTPGRISDDTYVYVCLDVYTCIYVYVCIYVCMYACMYEWMYVYVCMYVCMNECMMYVCM